MELTPGVREAAENLQRSYQVSPEWAPALVGATMRSSTAPVELLSAADSHYFIVEFTKSALITARFAIAQNGVLLEAEGVRHATAALRPFIDPASVGWWARGRSFRQVWTPCDQTTTRLRPLWEISAPGDTPRYIRADGVVFDRITIVSGRG